MASSEAGVVGFSVPDVDGMVMVESVDDVIVVVSVIDGKETVTEAEAVGDTVEARGEVMFGEV
jgi:hypothetical protein